MGVFKHIYQSFFTKKLTIPICLASDDNYAQHCRVTITSILFNSNKNTYCNFYILDGGISKKNKDKILKLKKIKKCKISFFKIDNKWFKDCPITGENHFNIVNYYRIKIPSFFPKLDKIIYLDSDLVVKKDLSKIYKTNISNYYLAAAEAQTSEINKARMQMPKKSHYINSGVLVINSKKWRKDKIEDQIFSFIKNNQPEKLINVDQDAINGTIFNSIKLLKQNWNTEIRTDVKPTKKYQKIINNPYILHYVSVDKPWSKNTKQNTIEYNKYLKLSELNG